MQEVTLRAPKMSCGHCTMTVESAGREVEGVESIRADFQTKEIVVDYDENRTTLDAIKKAITDSGYPVE